MEEKSDNTKNKVLCVENPGQCIGWR